LIQVDHLEDVFAAVLLAVHHQEVRQRELRVERRMLVQIFASSACTGVRLADLGAEAAEQVGGLLPAFLPDAPYQARQ